MRAGRVPIPRMALLLGIAGLLPFLLASGLCLFAGDPLLVAWAYSALVGWSACSLSALGAVQAGRALRTAQPASRDLLLGAAAPLWAWLALGFGGDWGLLAMSLGFILLQGWDQYLAQNGHLPNWYPRLRLPLTGVVLLCLFAVTISDSL